MIYTYEVDFTRQGQERPYADHIWRATIERFKNGESYPMLESEAKRIARVLVHNWVDEAQWFEPSLTEFTKREDGSYLVEVTEAFKD